MVSVPRPTPETLAKLLARFEVHGFQATGNLTYKLWMVRDTALGKYTHEAPFTNVRGADYERMRAVLAELFDAVERKMAEVRTVDAETGETLHD